MKRMIMAVTAFVLLLQTGSLAVFAATADGSAGGVDPSSATVWICTICGILFCAVIAMVVILAKKNRGSKK